MSELENHFIEEAAHNPGDPQGVTDQRVISRLGSPRRLAARLNRSRRAPLLGDPIFVTFPLAFGLHRRWRQAMADIPANALQILFALTGFGLVPLLRLRFDWILPVAVGQVLFYFAARRLMLWNFDHLTRAEVERVTTIVLGVAIAGYIVDSVIMIRPIWEVDARLAVGWIVAVALIGALLAFRLRNAMRWRPKPWAGVEIKS
jgi:hypothetical protein